MLSLLVALPFLSANPQMIVPENNFYIPANQKSMYDVTEEDFNQVIDGVSQIYSKEMINILRDWEDGTANAIAQVFNEERYVTFYGGFARFPGMTKDSFALVVCHEFAHHLGGKPRITASWASAEGQADYFGAKECLQKYFIANPLDLQEQAELPTMEYIDQSCAESYGTDQEKINACVRGVIAGEDLAVTFAKFEGYVNEFPSILTPSEYKVTKTIRDKYPSVQCRLDTFFNGALGLERPACWFKD